MKSEIATKCKVPDNLVLYATLLCSFSLVLACAGYLGHPFVENDEFCERMSQVADTSQHKGADSLSLRIPWEQPWNEMIYSLNQLNP